VLRGEVWWVRLPPPARMRPVVLLSRNKAIQVRSSVTVAQVTRTIRRIPTEVPLGKQDGMPKTCTINTDVLFTIPKKLLTKRICTLDPAKSQALTKALKFALGL